MTGDNNNIQFVHWENAWRAEITNKANDVGQKGENNLINMWGAEMLCWVTQDFTIFHHINY